MRNSGSVFQNMDGYSSKLAGELHNYNYSSSAQHFGPVSGGVSGPVQSMTSTSQFITQQSHSSSQLDSNIGLATGQGTNLQEEFCEGTGVGGGGGRKKKKKQKSGEDPSTSVKPNIMPEEDLVDAAIPLLSENQGCGPRCENSISVIKYNIFDATIGSRSDEDKILSAIYRVVQKLLSAIDDNRDM
nr:uncharacterized protein LOC128700320 isoform X3 [Cherax quadricarinatus]